MAPWWLSSQTNESNEQKNEPRDVAPRQAPSTSPDGFSALTPTATPERPTRRLKRRRKAGNRETAPENQGSLNALPEPENAVPDTSDSSRDEAPKQTSRKRRRRRGSRSTSAEAPEIDPSTAGPIEQAQTVEDPKIVEPVQKPKRKKRKKRKKLNKNSETGALNAAPEQAHSEPKPAEPPLLPTDGLLPEESSSVDDPLGSSVVYVPERGQSSNERKIGMFVDFENIALGVRDSDIKTFDVTLVLERLLEKGKIIVKRAYADWERYSDFKRPLHEAAIELIDIPQKYYSGKNSADIKMVVDAMDLCYAKEHLDTFVMVSGDSDFSPLVSKLKENDKYVIGLGVKSSSSSLLIDNCDEFIYYEDLWRDSLRAPRLDHLPKKMAECFELLAEAMQALFRDNKDVLWGSMIKQTMKRKRPSFNEGYYGYSAFSELLQDAERKQIIRLRRDRRSGSYVVLGFAPQKK